MTNTNPLYQHSMWARVGTAYVEVDEPTWRSIVDANAPKAEVTADAK